MNAVHCNHCDTTIESRHRHDFVWCNCEDEEKRVAVDGGNDYHKRCFGKESDYEEVRGATTELGQAAGPERA